MAAVAPAVDERLEAYADLAVRVGANVQEGQTVFLNTQVEHAPLARALTRAAYRAGARYVDVRYRDDHVRHAMIELGPDEALTHSPEWMKMLYHAMEGQAQLWTTGDPEPELMTDLDGERVGRARMKEVIEIIRSQMVERLAQLVRRRLPERRLGDAGLRRARRRAALGGGRVLHAARRGGPGSSVARPHGSGSKDARRR